MSTTAKIQTFKNDDYQWLTYESIYNEPKFRHTDDVCPMGIYTMPLDNTRIMVTGDLFKGTSGSTNTKVEILLKTFFKNVKSDDLLNLLVYKPWTANNGINDGTYDVEWAKRVAAFCKKSQTSLVNMPYNVYNNTDDALALGSRYKSPPNPPKATQNVWQGVDTFNPGIVLTSRQWPMWESASRSCIMLAHDPESPPQVAIIGPNGKPASAPFVPANVSATSVVENVLVWQFSNGPNFVAPAGNVPSPGSFNFLAKASPPVREVTSNVFSVKTGVATIGSDQDQGSKSNQTGAGGKGVLETDNIVAVLRTEWIKALDEKFATIEDAAVAAKTTTTVAALKAKIAILPEVLTITVPVTEKNNSWEKIPAERGLITNVRHDGFQLRDLSLMNEKLRYFPALSAPWVTATPLSTSPKYDLKTLKSQNAMDNTEFKEWDRYWSVNYAKLLGQTKAVIHLLYGFQPLTPNAQNFLLEMDPKDLSAPKRVFMRDVLDFKLHTQWFRTVFSIEARKNTDLDLALSDSSKPMDADLSFVPMIRKLLNFERTSMSPWDDTTASAGTTATTNPRASMLSGSETFESVRTAANTQFCKGLQLNFFSYSMFVQGRKLQRDAQTAPPPTQWRRLTAAMIRWGIKHALAFVDEVNSALNQKDDFKLKAGGTPIDEGYLNKIVMANALPGTETIDKMERLVLTKDSVVAPVNPFITITDMGAIQEQLNGWEQTVSDAIQKAIYEDPAVRERLRKLVRTGIAGV